MGRRRQDDRLCARISLRANTRSGHRLTAVEIQQNARNELAVLAGEKRHCDRFVECGRITVGDDNLSALTGQSHSRCKADTTSRSSEQCHTAFESPAIEARITRGDLPRTAVIDLAAQAVTPL